MKHFVVWTLWNWDSQSGSVLQIHHWLHWISHSSQGGAEVQFYPQKVQEKYKAKRKLICEFVDCTAVSEEWVFIDSLSSYGITGTSSLGNKEDPQFSSSLDFQSDCLCSWHTPFQENLALSTCPLMGMVLSHIPEWGLHVVCKSIMAKTSQGLCYWLNTTGRDLPVLNFCLDPLLFTNIGTT